MNDIKFYQLPNIGILKTKIPDILYKKLLKESLEAKSKNTRLQTGLTGSGVSDHYVLKYHRKELENYILNLVDKYCQNYSEYLNNINILSKDCSLYVDQPWINLQKKYEYIPNHHHDGILSYSIWIKIPYEKEKETNYKKLNFKKQNFHSFEFSYSNVLGELNQFDLKVSKEDEGIIQMFPSKLIHSVYPFYTSNDYRISVSGNIKFKVESL